MTPTHQVFETNLIQIKIEISLQGNEQVYSRHELFLKSLEPLRGNEDQGNYLKND
jgi:hypothetical protein